MPDLEGTALEDLKQTLLDASNAVLAAFDGVEDGEITPEARSSVVDAHNKLMEVHAVFKEVQQQQLMARY